MRMRNLAAVTLALGLAAGLLATQGCYVDTGYPASAEVVGSYGYEPQYYDGYMVYHDDVGRPFYYANGVRVFVSPASPYYSRYVAHYRMYGPAYGRWYANHGYRYRGYRLQGGYYGGHYGHRYGGPAYRGRGWREHGR